jgi:hypothetical protein
MSVASPFQATVLELSIVLTAPNWPAFQRAKTTLFARGLELSLGALAESAAGVFQPID